jgi:hypothetical protein
MAGNTVSDKVRVTPIERRAKWAQSLNEHDIQPMGEAPKDATELLVVAKDRYGNRFWIVVHWAQGGGEDQPPFRGWFYQCGDGYAQVGFEMLGWLPLPRLSR